MKNLVKNNLIAVFAVLLGVATMSFKMVEKATFATTWFSVATGGSIGASVDPNTCPGGTILCAVAFNNSDLVGGNPPITNAYNDPDKYIQGRRHKN